MTWKLSKFVETVHFQDKGKKLVALFNTKNSKLSVVSQNLWDTIAYRLDRQLPLNNIAPDFIEDFFVDNTIDEIACLLLENETTRTFYKTLRYTIMVSGNCNFACNYCGQNHIDISLANKHQDLITSQIQSKLQSGFFNTLKISWFGGEPLLAIDVIRSMSDKLVDICSKIGINYVSTLTTNAYLLNRGIASECAKNFHVKEFYITIDGGPSEHNARRCLRGGQGTFSTVYQNLKVLLEVINNDPGIEVVLRCNIDTRNPDSIFHLLDIMESDQLYIYKNLIIILAPIHDWGNDAGKDAVDS